MSKVFLSHSHKDKSFVDRLANDLHIAGIEVWYDSWDLEIGHDLTLMIQNGISASDFLAVVLSPAALDSEWVQKEWSSAFNRELEERQVVVLPLLYQDCDMPLFLKSKVHVDFRNAGDYDASLSDLIRFLRGESRRPARVDSPTITPAYVHTVRVNYQGVEQIRRGNELEISNWFGPDGAGGSRELRVAHMLDITDGVKYTSDIANVTMTIIPTNVSIQGRVAGAITRGRGSTSFDFEMTEEEYSKFDRNRVVRRSPLVR